MGVRTTNRIWIVGLGCLMFAGFAGVAQNAEPPAPSEPADDPVAVLLLGIMRLDETEALITPEEAARILPLAEAWRAQLGTQEDGRMNAEDKLADLQAILTADQLERIDAMSLTMADVVRWRGSESPGMPPDEGRQPGEMPPPGAPDGTPPEGSPPTGDSEQPPASSGADRPQGDDRLASFADGVIRFLATRAGEGN